MNYRGGSYCLTIEKQEDETYRLSISHGNIPLDFDLSTPEKETLCPLILDYMLNYRE